MELFVIALGLRNPRLARVESASWVWVRQCLGDLAQTSQTSRKLDVVILLACRNDRDDIVCICA